MMRAGKVAMRCPVCNGNTFVAQRDVFDDRYGEPGCYQLACCVECCHLATAPRLTEEQLPALYGTYYPRKSITPESVQRDASFVSRPLAALRRWWMGIDNQGQYTVSPGERMLDVGCGSGASLLEASALGAHSWGIEADPNVGPISQVLGLRIHFGSLKDVPFDGQNFDVVVLNQVIEHIPEPDLALQLIRQRLAPGGRIVLVFPNVDSLWRRLSGPRWINWHIPYHLHHFNLQTFARMAERCGYQVGTVRSITPNVWTLLQLRASRYEPQIGQPSPVWMGNKASFTDGSSRENVVGVRLLRHLLRQPVLFVFALLNRCVDAAGQGDSLMVELRPEAER